MEIRLTPAGHLRLESDDSAAESTAPPSVLDTFQHDWRQGLFALAAEKVDPGTSPTVRFWKLLADRYLTGLCHIPESVTKCEVTPPSSADFGKLILTAPPMQGGEYLSEDVLRAVWDGLDQWVQQMLSSGVSLNDFLRTQAPKWRQVGRVCFHLAENRGDEATPFAFMVTYTSGFGAGGKLTHLPLRKALERYTSASNRPALVKLLSPVHHAAGACDWVKTLVDSGEIYNPTFWSPEQAYRFLRSVPTLEESGLSVRVPDWWRKRARPQVLVSIGGRKNSALGAEAMLDFDAHVALGGTGLSREEVADLLQGEDGLVLLHDRWVEVDREKLQQAIDHWDALKKHSLDGQISFIEGMRLLAGASADLRHEEQVEEERPWVHLTAGTAMRELLAALRDPERLNASETRGALKGTLRPYQESGLAWLRLLTELELGACLADDMGLGKTLQVLALLLCNSCESTNGRNPSLLIVPASLLGNWRQEAARFAPSLKLLFLHPAETSRDMLSRITETPDEYLEGVDLAVTTYSMVSRQKWLAEQPWRIVILDEAQAIKNSTTLQAKAVKRLPARARIALTGTPVENRLSDLWSLFDFLNPGLLGSAAVFKNFVDKLQVRKTDQFAPLRRLTGPYILRRLKTDPAIISDLPDKTETVRYCNLTKTQVKLYEKTVQTMMSSIETADGITRRGLVLQTLMRLKQVCNHPSQLSKDEEYASKDSGKFVRLAEICEELAERQEKVLVFTQFREIIDPLADHMASVFRRSGLVLHGGTAVSKRGALVERFQDEDGPPFFILSLKAGGTGLNLTAASHVVHFDRWWNPAVENQATDRAFRIGQKRNVLVHKFIVSGTVEERIDELIREKQHLAEELLSGDGEVNVTDLPDDELLKLVSLDVNRASL